MRLHLPSIAAFAGTLLAAATFADYRTENRRLRERVFILEHKRAELEGENDALAAMVDDFARQAAMAQHPAGRGLDAPKFAQPITTEEFADAMAVLDDDDCGPSDLLWMWGGEVQ